MQPLNLPTELTARYQDPARGIERRPFLINDYLDTGGVLQELRKEPVEANQVFLGIPGFYALDMICAAGADSGKTYRQAILYDANIVQVKAMNALLTLVSACKNADEFIGKFEKEYIKFLGYQPSSARPSGHRRLLYHVARGQRAQPMAMEGLDAKLQQLKQNPESWLYGDHYARIRKLVDEDRIVTATLDLRDEGRIRVLQSYLDSQKLVPKHIYISSAPEFIDPYYAFDYYSRPNTPEGGRKFIDHLRALAGKEGKLLVSLDTGERPPRAPYRLHEKTPDYLAKLEQAWLKKPYTPAERYYRYYLRAGDLVMYLHSNLKEQKAPGREERLFIITGDNRPLTDRETQSVAVTLREQGLNVSGEEGPGPLQFMVPVASLNDSEAFFSRLARALEKALSVPAIKRA